MAKKIINGYIKKLIHRLPQDYRYKFIRSRLHLDYELPPELSFKIADTEEELESSFRLLHDSYVELGYMPPNKSNMRITYYHMLPSTTNLIAKYNDKVIATVSIIRDSAQGLPLESEFNLEEYRKNKSTLAEISSLVVDRQYRHEGGRILFPLLKFLWLYCYYYFAIDYIVMATHPKLADMFDAIILFSPLSEKIVPNYGFANGAPAVARILNLKTAPLLYATKYGDMSKNKNLFQFMVPTEMGGDGLQLHSPSQ